MTHKDLLYEAIAISDMVYFKCRIFPLINHSAFIATLSANKITQYNVSYKRTEHVLIIAVIKYRKMLYT